MANTALIQSRVSPEIKQGAEQVLDKLGLDIPTTIRIFLSKINEDGDLPFEIRRGQKNHSATLREKIFTARHQLLSITEKYGATNLRLFGSVADGTAGENSDIDFIVDHPGEKHLAYMAALSIENEFRETLGTQHIDVTTPKTMRPEVAEGLKHATIIPI